MINKIKDFLKNKLAKKPQVDLSDQIEQEPDPEHDHESTLSKFKVPLAALVSKLKKPTSDEPSVPAEVTEAPPKESTLSKFRIPVEALMAKMKRSDVIKPRPVKNIPVAIPSGKGLSPSLRQGVEKFLSRHSRESIHQLFLVTILSTLTYTIGKITALAIKGNPNVVNAREQATAIQLDNDFNPATLNQVKSINIFRTNTGLKEKKKVADTRCDKPQQSSSLPIKLLNTVVLQDTIKSIASVQVRGDRLLQEVRIGDQISNLAKIFKIDRLEILVRNLENGMCESITSDKLMANQVSPISTLSPAASRQYILNKKMPGIENVGNKFTISKTLIDEKMKDIAAILTQARAIKIQNPDGTMSFKLTEMDPEGIFPYLGLQDQDIITSINGKPIYDMNEVMTLFGRIKNLDSLSLGVKREGSEAVQDYTIKK